MKRFLNIRFLCILLFLNPFIPNQGIKALDNRTTYDRGCYDHFSGSVVMMKLTSNPQDTASGWFEYQVRSKVTLYDLAIRYQVSIDEIIGLNPGIAEQPAYEEIIRIPYSKPGTVFITHKVTQRQTVARLAKNYKIDVETLIKANPYISRYPEPGQIVRIPLGDAIPPETKPVAPAVPQHEIIKDMPASQQETDKCDRPPVMGSYKVAVMLPFYYSEYDAMNLKDTESPGDQEKAESIKSFAFVQFYEGFTLALDSLKKLGLTIDAYVYNVEDDILSAKQALNDPVLKDMDLIIGPVYNKCFTVVANFAREHQIYIVNPFTSREEIIRDNPYVIKVYPGQQARYKSLVEYLNEHHKKSQVIVVFDGDQDTPAGVMLKNELDKDLLVRQFPFSGKYTELIYNRENPNAFTSMASADHENVFIIMSEKKVFILDFLRRLNEKRDKYAFTVVGLPAWNKIEGLDLTHLNNLKTHYLTEEFIDYTSMPVLDFVKKFRETYFTEPQKYGFAGYDIGFYFSAALMKYGDVFGQCLNHFRMNLLQTGFDFKANAGQGYENQYWNILKVQDLKFIDVTPKLKPPVFWGVPAGNHPERH